MSDREHLAAHHALGRLYSAATASEFADAARVLAEAVRRLVADTGPELTPYLREELTMLERHPLLRAQMPAVYVSRLARGSEAPPIHGVVLARRPPSTRPSPDDFYFEDADKRPAIQLCIEVVDRVDRFIDARKRRASRPIR